MLEVQDTNGMEREREGEKGRKGSSISSIFFSESRTRRCARLQLVEKKGGWLGWGMCAKLCVKKKKFDKQPEIAIRVVHGFYIVQSNRGRAAL